MWQNKVRGASSNRGSIDLLKNFVADPKRFYSQSADAFEAGLMRSIRIPSTIFRVHGSIYTYTKSRAA